MGVMGRHRDEESCGVFVRFRAPLREDDLGVFSFSLWQKNDPFKIIRIMGSCFYNPKRSLSIPSPT
jgi:hypothetical protein